MSSTYGRITLDLDKLVYTETLTPELAAKLVLSKEPTAAANTLISVLYIIGAIAAAAGVVLLKPTAITGLVIAAVCFGVGQFIRFKKWAHLDILALALGIGSAAGLTGWFALEFGEILPAIAINGFATGVTLVMALAFRSRFLAALVPIGIGTMIGSGGAYWHASYGIFVREAAVTIALFVPIAAALWALAMKVRHPDWKPMATVAARMAFIIANFGFWVGSLWGDHVGEYFMVPNRRAEGMGYSEWLDLRNAFKEQALYIPDAVFAVGWAVFAVAAIALGRKIGNRFLELAGVVFLAINAFTQYFEFFKDEPWALIFGGIALVGIALALVRWQMGQRPVTT
ncbi:hypothetical protein ACFQ14_06805 [Pseudahrensia aquimaris]|uniref:DUF2157 domain-containing protein n=1 Tax=Pseudahrensia aquimaris TaxID=744461 RepID=A0ABW3FCC4_9HYPH